MWAGRVRFVGDAHQRIEEDVLRLLRFFRFHAHYGTPPPDAESLSACRGMAHLLPGLSAERVRAELLKLLGAPDPAPVIVLMRDEGVLEHFLPQATAIDRLARMTAIETGLGENDPLRRLAALVPMDAHGAREIARALRLSNAERARLVAMASPGETLSPDMDGAARRRARYRIGVETWADLLLVTWASGGSDTDDPNWQSLYTANGWTRPEFPLTGRDIKRAGVEDGPKVGELLRAVEEWWIAGDFRASRRDCLEELARRSPGNA